MAVVRRRSAVLTAGLVVCLATAAVVAYVVSSRGFSARHVQLNDGGIWATSDRDGLIGRANLPAGTLDTALELPGVAQQNGQLDVVQDGAAVIARDRAGGKLYPLDAATGQVLADAGISFGADGQLAVGGGTVAVLDPQSGKVWAQRYDPEAGLNNLAALGGRARPVAVLGSAGGTAGGAGTPALAVGSDGTVRALSASGKLATVRPSGALLSRATYRQLHATFRAPQLTSVGDEVVVFDAATGAVLLPGGHTATVGDRDAAARLQQPGPAASDAVIATSTALFAVRISDGHVRRLTGSGSGAPAVPVPVGRCVYAAWTGSPGAAARSCSGRRAVVLSLTDERTLVQPQIRANRGGAALNDAVSGGLWDLRTGRRLDDWDQVKPPTTVKPKPNDQHPSKQVGRIPAPPHAMDDTLGARPGRTTVLHVLDNDSDPAGRILSIGSVSAPSDPDASVQIAPDGQTVQIALPASAGVQHFRYTVNDGKGLTGSAAVTVEPRPFDGPDKAPALRAGFVPKVWTVAGGGKLSLPVIGDWRDYDGDPPVLTSATASAGSISTTPDGRLNYVAPISAGPQTLTYRVTDGIETAQATVAVNVLAATSVQTVPATAEPDVARGQVRQPIVVRPLDNDLPGADPGDPNAQLELAADVANPDGTTVTTDRQAGTVTVTAEHPGTFTLAYTVAFGAAAYARGTVRVDVQPPPPAAEKPIAMQDTATLHGQVPTVVDVLANDFDPAGRLLVVESARPEQRQLQVAVIQGRYLRIDATVPELDPNPQVIDYVITDGVSGSVTGQVVVDQQPEPADDTPVPQDDFATVRAGDTVSVAVLDNDVAPSGDALSLAPQVQGGPGPGRLPAAATDGRPGGVGVAYVAGNVVRYVAPTDVSTERSVTVQYVVRNSAGDQAVGQLFLTLEPLPTAAHPDQVPTPPEIDVRVVAGDTVTIPIRTTGSDPDGDSVTLAGITSAPTLGRVLGSTPSTLRYQAYPTSAGTDSFTYAVVDRFGRTGTAALRIAVVPPGDPQPPVAADVTVTAAPGSTVAVDVMAQAFIGLGDEVTIEPLAETNGDALPGGARLRSRTGPIEVRASRSLTPVVVRYAIDDGLSASYATLTVRSRPGTNLPPVAADDYANPTAGHDLVSVDPLTKAYDPDGAGQPLRITRVFDRAATVTAGRITVPVTDRPQVVPYEISDAGGATAMAVVFVPARGAGAPHAKPDQLIDIPKANGTRTIDIADFAVDPAGKPLQLTTDAELSASPADGLRLAAPDSTHLVLTAQQGYVGPAAITFQVTNGTSLTDPNGQFGVITVPVQIGPETPVLRCPTTPITVVEGGDEVDVPVTSLCHVWVADDAELADIEYTATWKEQPAEVGLSGFGTRTLHLQAGGAARPGATGTITVGVAGAQPVPATLRIVVGAAPPPTVAPVTVDGVIAGRTASVDLARYVYSPLHDKVISIVSVGKISGLGARPPATAGSRVTLSPTPDAHGTEVFQVIVTDVADRTRTERQAVGRITLHVLGVPDPPTRVGPGRNVLSHEVTLTWDAPANNGEPIDYYEVAWSDGTHRCAASPCTITGLTNGVPYVFTVRAHNAVGFSRPSAPSRPAAEPNTVPQAPTGLATSDPQDGRLQIAWQPAKVDGTPVLKYLVTYPGHSLSTAGTSVVAIGLDNDAPTTFTVYAINKQGRGPGASVQGESAGVPQYPPPPAQPQALPAPTLDTTQAGDHQAVRISWNAVDPNGPKPVTYAHPPDHRLRSGRGVLGGAGDLLLRPGRDQRRQPGVVLLRRHQRRRALLLAERRQLLRRPRHTGGHRGFPGQRHRG